MLHTIEKQNEKTNSTMFTVIDLTEEEEKKNKSKSSKQNRK